MFFLKSQSRFLILFEALLLLSAPPALAATGLMPYNWRFLPFGVVTGLMVIRLVKDRWRLENIGIKFENWIESFSAHLATTIVSVGSLYVVSSLLNLSESTRPLSLVIIGVSIALSFIQELVFRVYLIESLIRHNFSKSFVVFLSAFTFAFIHMFFESYWQLYVPLCFAYGLIMAWLYLRYKNLIFLTASHIVLNLISIHLNLV